MIFEGLWCTQGRLKNALRKTSGAAEQRKRPYGASTEQSLECMNYLRYKIHLKIVVTVSDRRNQKHYGSTLTQAKYQENWSEPTSNGTSYLFLHSTEILSYSYLP